MKRLMLYALVISALRHGILLHAVCVMSTHLHYVITDPDGTLPRFLEMFHRLVALGVKKLRKWDGAVWERKQTSVVELCTRQAIVEKIAYTLANPVKAGLVWHAHEWPGAKTLVKDIGCKVLRVKRPNRYFSSKNAEWDVRVKLDVCLPPSIDAGKAQEFRNDVASELANLEAVAHTLFPRHTILGAKQATNVPPERRITSPKKTHQRNPSFAVGRNNLDLAIELRKNLRAFRAAYRAARTAWRSGNRAVEFPAGTYAMLVFHGANVATNGKATNGNV